ncbi:hypothetical protein HDU76_007650, partial [Blyttiomyces sp. JEL0837]
YDRRRPPAEGPQPSVLSSGSAAVSVREILHAYGTDQTGIQEIGMEDLGELCKRSRADRDRPPRNPSRGPDRDPRDRSRPPPEGMRERERRPPPPSESGFSSRGDRDRSPPPESSRDRRQPLERRPPPDDGRGDRDRRPPPRDDRFKPPDDEPPPPPPKSPGGSIKTGPPQQRQQQQESKSELEPRHEVKCKLQYHHRCRQLPVDLVMIYGVIKAIGIGIDSGMILRHHRYRQSTSGTPKSGADGRSAYGRTKMVQRSGDTTFTEEDRGVRGGYSARDRDDPYGGAAARTPGAASTSTDGRYDTRSERGGDDRDRMANGYKNSPVEKTKEETPAASPNGDTISESGMLRLAACVTE